MISIIKPLMKTVDVLDACISNMTDINLKNELNQSKHLFETAETEFDSKKANNTLSSITRGQFVSTNVTVSVLKKLYQERMIVKGNLGRDFYNALILLAPKGKCPLCCHRKATTLDHYLPKSKYALLSITPINLVPACKECNIGKKIAFPTASKEETLHPYYDSISAHNWLKMEVISPKPFIVEYYVEAHNSWTTLLGERTKAHFESFNLNELYSDHAVEFFDDLRLTFEEAFNLGGSDGLKLHLEGMLRSAARVNINSWRSAFFNEISSNISFYGGGFI